MNTWLWARLTLVISEFLCSGQNNQSDNLLLKCSRNYIPLSLRHEGLWNVEGIIESTFSQITAPDGRNWGPEVGGRDGEIWAWAAIYTKCGVKLEGAVVPVLPSPLIKEAQVAWSGSSNGGMRYACINLPPPLRRISPSCGEFSSESLPSRFRFKDVGQMERAWGNFVDTKIISSKRPMSIPIILHILQGCQAQIWTLSEIILLVWRANKVHRQFIFKNVHLQLVVVKWLQTAVMICIFKYCQISEFLSNLWNGSGHTQLSWPLVWRALVIDI